jgi:uncharacterized membrane protein YccC
VSERPHPVRTSLAVLVATLVGVALATTFMAAALPEPWLSVATALAISVVTAGTYTTVREGPRAMIGLLRR